VLLWTAALEACDRDIGAVTNKLGNCATDAGANCLSDPSADCIADAGADCFPNASADAGRVWQVRRVDVREELPLDVGVQLPGPVAWLSRLGERRRRRGICMLLWAATVEAGDRVAGAVTNKLGNCVTDAGADCFSNPGSDAGWVWQVYGVDVREELRLDAGVQLPRPGAWLSRLGERRRR